MKFIQLIVMILSTLTSQIALAGQPSKSGAQAFRKYFELTEQDAANPKDNTRSTIPGDESKVHAILKTKDGFKTGTVEGVVKRSSGEVRTFKFKIDPVKKHTANDFIEIRREKDMIVVDRDYVRQQFTIEDEKSTALRVQKQYMEFDKEGEKKLAAELENAKGKKQNFKKGIRITTVKSNGKEKKISVDLSHVKGKIVSFQPKLSKDKKTVTTRILASDSGKFREYNATIDLKNAKQKLSSGKVLSAKKVKAENVLVESTVFKPTREEKKSRKTASIKIAKR